VSTRYWISRNSINEKPRLDLRRIRAREPAPLMFAADLMANHMSPVAEKTMTKQTATTAIVALCALLGSCGGGDSQPTNAATREVASIQKSSCRLSSTSGIEGTGLRNKLTGRITDITTPSSNAGGNTTVAVGSTCSFTADGASVFQGGTPASLSDLRVDQIITAEGDFTDTQNASANRIFILQNGANGQLPLVQLGENFDFVPSNCMSSEQCYPLEGILFDGPGYSVLPQAQVLVDGTPVSVTGLTIGEGEIVLLAGTDSFPDSNNPGGLLDSAAVKITHMVDGPVDAIDIAHNQIVVLGVTVEFSPGTFFEMTGGQLTPGAINVGDRVTVSGHPTASGLVFATRIAFTAITGDFLVSGIVGSPNPAQHQFSLNRVAIDYSSAQSNGVPASGPAAGERVIVHTVRSANGASLTATSISDDSELPGAGTGTVVSMHGIVTSALSPTTFTVDGYPIIVTAAALQTCGSAPAADSDVTLQGIVAANGTVVADIFCFTGPPPPAPGIVQGRIQKIEANYGTISIVGFSAQPSVLTRVIDSSGSPLSLGDLRVGDSIAVDGAYGSIPELIWADGIVRLNGPQASMIDARYDAISFADPIVVVMGQPIATDANTTFSYISPAGDGTQTIPMWRDLFFSNPHRFPFWDRFCKPNISFTVEQRVDGSLVASSILWEPDYC
jgi:hypothetical protein